MVVLSVYLGWEHNGGFVFGAIMLAIIAFVWRIIVGKKTEDSIGEETTISEADNSDNQKEEVALKGSELLDQRKEFALQQDGIAVSMKLSKEILEQMEVLRQENPQKWFDNEVELVKSTKKRMQGIAELKESERIETISSEEKSVQSEISSNPIIEVQLSQGIFGDKLESEYRRETKADSHWIRQDDTEICINIEESVYRKMVELQSENPKKWVNKELDLFKKAKSILLEQCSPNKFFFGRK